MGLQRVPSHWTGPTNAPASVVGTVNALPKASDGRGWRKTSPEESHMELSSIACAMAFPSTSCAPLFLPSTQLWSLLGVAAGTVHAMSPALVRQHSQLAWDCGASAALYLPSVKPLCED